MDSLTQAVLGASVTCAVMGRHARFRTAVLVGAVAGTLPDLDVLIDHGDELMNMVRHRAESHSLFFLSLAAPLFGWLTLRCLQGRSGAQNPPLLWRWCLAWWLTFMTHVGIDAMTNYGTQWAQPFTDHAFAVGSVFIVDPLYTVPLIIGLLVAGWRAVHGRTWHGANHIALAFSCCYLLWSVAAQQHVRHLAESALEAQGVEHAQVRVSATTFNTVLWRVLAITPTHSYEGFYSLFDEGKHIGLTATPRGNNYLQRWAQVPHVQALRRFTQDQVRMELRDGRVLMTDLRIGEEPDYIFVFDLGTPAELNSGHLTPQIASNPVDWPMLLDQLWRRMWGRTLAPDHPAFPQAGVAPGI